MAPLAFHEVGAQYALYVVLGMFGASEWSIRVRSHMNRGGTRHERGSLYFVIVTSVVGVFGAFALARNVHSAGLSSARWPVFIAGLVIVILGIALRQWSVRTLGQFFTVRVQVKSDQSVVDTGPYRWVRHPSYTAIIISFIGIGVALENWLALAVLIVVPTVGLIVRIRVEERALLDALGDPYRQFAAGRARLVPKVW